MSNALAEIAKYQKKIAQLKKHLSKNNRKLLALPGKFGFKNVSELIQALQAASSSGAKQPKASDGKRPRSKITPEIKAQVKSMVGADKTGKEISHALGISLPSVQNIKKELGLVQERKGK
jgi:hypothetical protein